MSSEIQSIRKKFKKALKQYGTVVNAHYANKDATGKIVLTGDYLNVKVLIDPLGVGLNTENLQYANIKSSKAVFYIPMTYMVNEAEMPLNFRDIITGKPYSTIELTLPDNSFKWTLTGISPEIAFGNNFIYQVGVQ
jgi:hypothetical protein